MTLETSSSASRLPPRILPAGTLKVTPFETPETLHVHVRVWGRSIPFCIKPLTSGRDLLHTLQNNSGLLCDLCSYRVSQET